MARREREIGNNNVRTVITCVWCTKHIRGNEQKNGSGSIFATLSPIKAHSSDIHFAFFCSVTTNTRKHIHIFIFIMNSFSMKRNYKTYVMMLSSDFQFLFFVRWFFRALFDDFFYHSRSLAIYFLCVSGGLSASIRKAEFFFLSFCRTRDEKL